MPRPRLKQASDDAVFVDVDPLGGGHLRQTRHRHDVARQRDDEARARRDLDIADRHGEVLGRAELRRVIREAVLCLGVGCWFFYKHQDGFIFDL